MTIGPKDGRLFLWCSSTSNKSWPAHAELFIGKSKHTAESLRLKRKAAATSTKSNSSTRAWIHADNRVLGAARPTSHGLHTLNYLLEKASTQLNHLGLKEKQLPRPQSPTAAHGLGFTQVQQQHTGLDSRGQQGLGRCTKKGSRRSSISFILGLRIVSKNVDDYIQHCPRKEEGSSAPSSFEESSRSSKLKTGLHASSKIGGIFLSIRE
ncbi:hypothetical protein LR48_Vigan53s001100 [Vigna angularis]|uniref:Uncharacterized protein n=1 Tax=Phaseolus angularis TaxID=3914 RepID=A0A0L9T4B2_PHAAN|nr:hypothetical protein LR48_Vigan53s001100 [Vigna angularis]